jgi:hypothetical protein
MLYLLVTIFGTLKFRVTSLSSRGAARGRRHIHCFALSGAIAPGGIGSSYGPGADAEEELGMLLSPPLADPCRIPSIRFHEQDPLTAASPWRILTGDSRCQASSSLQFM